MRISDITKALFKMQDTVYRDFQAGLCPSLDKQKIIGVRIPLLRQYAKEISKSRDVSDFLCDLPHKYYEEDNLHAFIIEIYRDFDECIAALDRFLPHIDNWATCDSLRPKCFKHNKEKLLPKALGWIDSEHIYTKRFGIGVLMNHFLEESFDESHLEVVSDIKSCEYYINMMRAWYFETALAKQYDKAVVYLKENRLDVWTHNKTIQKAVESYRITAEKKDYLKTLRRK